MDHKIAHNLMTANTPMGRAYRNYLLDGLSDEQIMKILTEAPNQPKETNKEQEKNIGENMELELLKKLYKVAHEFDTAYCTLANGGENYLTYKEYEDMVDFMIEVEAYLIDK